jgi:hypothetical protein
MLMLSTVCSKNILGAMRFVGGLARVVLDPASKFLPLILSVKSEQL